MKIIPREDEIPLYRLQSKREAPPRAGMDVSLARTSVTALLILANFVLWVGFVILPLFRGW